MDVQPYKPTERFTNVQGLLCITCNRAVGYLENTNWLDAAHSYLAKYNHAHQQIL